MKHVRIADIGFTPDDVEFFLSPAEITVILQLSRGRAVSTRQLSVYGLGNWKVVAELVDRLRSRELARPRRGSGYAVHPHVRNWRWGPPKMAWVLTCWGKEVADMLKSAGWTLETVRQKRLV